MLVYYYFKLFNSIKEKHEIEFAEMELNSLFGKVERVRNFAEVVDEGPLKLFTGDGVRVQDMLAHELPYGEVHGFQGVKEELEDVSTLIRRLAYTREFFLVTESQDPEGTLKKIFRDGVLDKNVQYFTHDGHVLFRLALGQK